MSTVDERPNSLSLSFVEGLYADYLREPESVSPDWRHYFDRAVARQRQWGGARRCRVSSDVRTEAAAGH